MRRPEMSSLVLACLISAVAALPSPALAADAAGSPPPSAQPVSQVLEATIPVPGSPDWPIAPFGSIWVLAPDLPMRQGTGTPNLVRIDPATDEVAATIELP